MVQWYPDCPVQFVVPLVLRTFLIENKVSMKGHVIKTCAGCVLLYAVFYCYFSIT